VTSYALVVPRDPMIELHLRISRKLVVALVVIFVVLPVIWMLLQTLGSASGTIKIDPVRTVTTP
jgi:ABC-type glycerol-3-phosphate transport system permease component